MPEIEIKKDESFEAALRRFKKKIEQEGILREVRDRKHYEKPSAKGRRPEVAGRDGCGAFYLLECLSKPQGRGFS